MQYIDTLVNSFAWIKNLYLYAGEAPEKTTSSSLLQPISANLHVKNFDITSSLDWNVLGKDQIGDLRGLYSSTEQLEGYYESFGQQAKSRLNATRLKIQNTYSQFLTVKAVKDLGGNSVTIKGGQLDNIDLDPTLYSTYGLMNIDSQQNVFTLRNTGVFSVIKSKTGNLGRFEVEKTSFPIMRENGERKNVIDGLKRTFWSAESWSAGLVRNQSNDLTWLPSSSNEGFCILSTLRMERPVVFSEVFVSPAIENAIRLERISWTPSSVTDFVAGNFETITGWQTSANASVATGVGVDSTNALLITTPGDWLPQYAYYEFSASGAYQATMSTTLTQPGSGYLDDHRLEVAYRVKGNGIPAQVKVEWLDTFGNVIAQHVDTQLTSGVFNTHSFSCYRPDDGVMGRIYVGILEEVDEGVVYFDKVQAWLGEKLWDPDIVIYKDTSVSIPLRSSATRVSMAFSQRNPIRESRNSDLLKYQIGMREMDILYREYVPRGSVISQPLNINKEIRKLWMTCELQSSEKQGLQFVIYPYGNDFSYQILSTPNIVYSKGLDTNPTVELGEVFEVYTTEEIDNNLITSDSSTNIVLLDPINVADTFEGTDRDGKVTLTKPVHFRKAEFLRLESWLDTFGITDIFDPNSLIVNGISASGTWRSDVLSGTVSTESVPASAIVSTSGYRPLLVTVSNDRFTAYPDAAGSQSSQNIRTITLEELVRTTKATTSYSTVKGVLGYDEWLAETTLAQLELIAPGTLTVTNQPLNTTLRDYLNFSQLTKGGPKLRAVYDRLRANNQLSKSSSTETTTTTVSEDQNIFSVKFFPIITGRSGVAMKVYELDGSEYVEVSPSQYKVDAENGTVSFNKAITGSVYATYTFLVNPKDSSEGEELSARNIPSHSGYLTRNMTDYQFGTVPELTPFQPDPASVDYYPIIEYYVTPNSELVFAREFFKFGDQPAKISVEYQSLNVQPRFALYSIRSTSPTKSPEIKTLTMHYKDTGATKQRS